MEQSGLQAWGQQLNGPHPSPACRATTLEASSGLKVWIHRHSGGSRPTVHHETLTIVVGGGADAGKGGGGGGGTGGAAPHGGHAERRGRHCATRGLFIIVRVGAGGA